MFTQWVMNDTLCADQTAGMHMTAARMHMTISRVFQMGRVMRKRVFCICENEGADQLRSHHGLCVRCLDSALPLLPESDISSF